MQQDATSPSVAAPQPLMPLGAGTADVPSLAAERASLRFWLALAIGKLAAAHRARREATIARIVRSGLAAID